MKKLFARNRHIFSGIFALCMLLTIFATPLISYALPGIYCYNGTSNCLVPCSGATDCDYSALTILFSNIITYLFYIAVPISAIVFVYAGFLYMTAGANPSQVGKARRMFTKVAIGLAIMCAAWLIVHTIAVALLNPSYYSTVLGS